MFPFQIHETNSTTDIRILIRFFEWSHQHTYRCKYFTNSTYKFRVLYYCKSRGIKESTSLLVWLSDYKIIFYSCSLSSVSLIRIIFLLLYVFNFSNTKWAYASRVQHYLQHIQLRKGWNIHHDPDHSWRSFEFLNSTRKVP